MNFNKYWFLWRPTYYRLSRISGNACIGHYYRYYCQISCLYLKVHNSLKIIRAKAPDYKTSSDLCFFCATEPRLPKKRLNNTVTEWIPLLLPPQTWLMSNTILINLQPIFIITAFKERQTVPTTTERSEICKYYFTEHSYSEIHVEFRVR